MSRLNRPSRVETYQHVGHFVVHGRSVMNNEDGCACRLDLWRCNQRRRDRRTDTFRSAKRGIPHEIPGFFVPSIATVDPLVLGIYSAFRGFPTKWSNPFTELGPIIASTLLLVAVSVSHAIFAKQYLRFVEILTQEHPDSQQVHPAFHKRPSLLGLAGSWSITDFFEVESRLEKPGASVSCRRVL